jgi:hypothetical protein
MKYLSHLPVRGNKRGWNAKNGVSRWLKGVKENKKYVYPESFDIGENILFADQPKHVINTHCPIFKIWGPVKPSVKFSDSKIHFNICYGSASVSY